MKIHPMKKTKLFFALAIFLFSFSNISAQSKTAKFEKEKTEISKMLDDFNVAAANAEYEKYFSFFADESTFIGTDATEIWNKQEFKVWAKPHFDKKKTWNFTSLKRNIYFSQDGKYAWFDELLDTQMKICRGSGVLEKIGSQWKIKQYVLSTTVPNDIIDEVTKIKSPIEDAIILQLKK